MKLRTLLHLLSIVIHIYYFIAPVGSLINCDSYILQCYKT